MKIILVSHSYLAKGMEETINYIMGNQKKITSFSAYVNEEEEYLQQIEKYISNKIDQKIIFVTDILGGSINNDLRSIVAQKENYFLISGMNLPLVIGLLTDDFTGLNNSEIKNKIDKIIKESKLLIKRNTFDEMYEEDDF